jgi:hypothetical protein
MTAIMIAVKIKKAADKLPHRRYFALLPVKYVANELWAVKKSLRRSTDTFGQADFLTENRKARRK